MSIDSVHFHNHTLQGLFSDLEVAGSGTTPASIDGQRNPNMLRYGIRTPSNGLTW